MTDIIDKLRFLGTGYVGTTRGHTATLMNEAADLIEALQTAIFDGGFDLSPCRVCGKVIVCIPDGVPVCETCAAKE